MLTLASVADNPQPVTYSIVDNADETYTLRPLVAGDVAALMTFLQNLSAETRRFSTFGSYDRAMAQELCEAIAKYDKLRFVVEHPSDGIVGLLEFSFAIVASDRQRYVANGITLQLDTDCRFGPTLADAYQERGIGSRAMPPIKDVARRFGQQRMILWGGVLADNARAIHFYKKHGFVEVGQFVNDDAAMLDMICDL